MGRTAWFFCVFSVCCSAACSGGEGTRASGINQDPATALDSGAAGGGASGAGDTSGSGTISGADAATPGMGQADATAPGLGDQVAEYLTCKPDELNPVLDCLTVKCPMQADPLSLTACLLDDCTKLIEKVSPKCRDCVVAGIAQDTAGLVQNCLDTSSVLGDAGSGNLLPF